MDIEHKGQRLYHLARSGKEVERAARAVEIYSLELIDFNDDQLELDVHCSTVRSVSLEKLLARATPKGRYYLNRQ